MQCCACKHEVNQQNVRGQKHQCSCLWNPAEVWTDIVVRHISEHQPKEISMAAAEQSSSAWFPSPGSFNVNLRPPEILFKVIFWLGYFNSCLNPIIYPCYNREFKLAFIRILRCQCHQRKRPGFKAYNYRTSNISSSGHSRKGSADHNSSCLNGSQRTLPSSASPSPSYLSRGLPTCPEGEMLYIWGTSTPSPSTPTLLPGSPGNSQQGGLGAAKTPEEMSGRVFSFSFVKNRDKQGMHKDSVAPDNKVWIFCLKDLKGVCGVSHTRCSHDHSVGGLLASLVANVRWKCGILSLLLHQNYFCLFLPYKWLILTGLLKGPGCMHLD